MALPVPTSSPRTVPSLLLALAAAVLAATTLAAQPLAPVGDQAQVNHVITSGQNLPDVASGATGDSVVVWESSTSGGNDGSLRSIQARRYRADGTPAGVQFQVNTWTPGEQMSPAVAMAPDGRFVVAWQSDEGGGGPVDFDIRARVFTAAGTPIGNDFKVNTSFTAGDQRAPDVAWSGATGFGVAWESDDDAGANFDWNIVARLYDANGSATTGELVVNTLGGTQLDPAIAADGAGDYLLAWESDESYGSDTTTNSIQAQVLGAGAEVQVNDHPPVAGDNNPAVAISAGGAILVTWESTGSAGGDNSLSSIQGRLYDSGGSPGAVFQANSYITDDQRFPTAAFLPDGRFVIGWHSYGSFGNDTSNASVQLRGFSAAAVPFAAEIQANTYVSDNQRFPALTADGRGGLVAAWESYGSPGDDQNSSSIQARRFSLDLLFLDGFESGNAGAWSQVNP